MIKPKIEISDYRAALRLMDAQRHVLKEARASEGVVLAVEAILKFLHKLPPAQLDRLLGVPSNKSPAYAEKRALEKKASNFELSDVLAALDDADTPRSTLEAIAIGRFKVPSGSMRSMGSIDHLRETLRTYVRNERAHESISEVAQNRR